MMNGDYSGTLMYFKPFKDKEVERRYVEGVISPDRN